MKLQRVTLGLVINAIQKQKNILIQKYKKEGLYQNFGQKQVNYLKDKYYQNGNYSAKMNAVDNLIMMFNQWCDEFTGEGIQRYPKKQIKYKEVQITLRNTKQYLGDRNKHIYVNGKRYIPAVILPVNERWVKNWKKWRLIGFMYRKRKHFKNLNDLRSFVKTLMTPKWVYQHPQQFEDIKI